MYRVNYSQREESSLLSLTGRMTLIWITSDQQPAASPSSFCLCLSSGLLVSLSLSCILVSHWFWLNSQRSNFVVTTSCHYHFTSCNFYYMSGFSQSFLRNLRHGKKPLIFILYPLYFEHTAEALFIELDLLNALDEATEITQRARPTRIRVPT